MNEHVTVWPTNGVAVFLPLICQHAVCSMQKMDLQHAERFENIREKDLSFQHKKKLI